MFESLKYGSTDYTQLNAENQAMKTPLNLMMYCMPVGFGCAAVGLLVSAILAYVLGAMEAVVAHVSRRLNSRAGRMSKYGIRTRSEPECSAAWRYWPSLHCRMLM